MHRGYVKLWRKSLDNGMIKNPVLFTFWHWCLMKASHKKTKVMVGYQEVELMPGQFIFGRKKAAQTLGISERTVRTSLNTLSKIGNVTIKPTNKFSVITIINWDTYQADDIQNDQQNDQRVTNKRPTSDQQVTTNKNVKECKRNIKAATPDIFPVTEKMVQYFKKIGNHADIESLTEDFLLYHRKKGSEFKDWYSAWQTWAKKDIEYHPEHKNIPQNNKPVFDDLSPEKRYKD